MAANVDSASATISGFSFRPASWLRRIVRTGFVDAWLWVTATVGAFALRDDGQIESWSILATAVVGLTLVKLVSSVAFGLHRQSWRKFAFRDAATVAFSVAAVVAFVSTANALLPFTLLPGGVVVIDGVLTLLLMLAARGTVRFVDEERIRRASFGRRTRNVVLVGAGEAGVILAREIMRHPETGMQPVGFLDEDPSKFGRTVAAVPVLGGLSEIKEIVDRYDVDEILICIPSADGPTVRRIVHRVREAAPDVACRTMPALHEVLSGRVQINRIRNVTIDDLLRRPPVELDTGGILSYVRGRRVMVTGAGGSIGSELVRQVCAFAPEELILVGHGENSIYQLERELDVQWPSIRYTSVIAAVQNVTRLETIFERYRPEVIFHTAAHKHVPLMEFNPEEAVFNNIVGSRNLVELALEHRVTHFVNISTDKAVKPTSVMGASKRLVEMIVEAASSRASADQTFVSVRFGNVLGSRGSAVPIFKSQIERGGPVTVTHKEMVRYFMTVPEAARLVLQASAQGKNGEIYILDMGEPVKVLDLVTDLIRLSGFEPNVDIPIVFTGPRRGEKLHEELMTEQESASRTGHDKIFVARPQPVDPDVLYRAIDELVDAALRSDGEEIRLLLSQLIDGARLELPKVTAEADGRSAAPALKA